MEIFSRFVSRTCALAGSICFRLSRLVYQSPQEKRVIPWFRDKGDKTHRLNYDLTETSVVFDLGGYEGQWASDIFSMYRCEIHVFEPVAHFAQSIQQRFRHNSKIQVYGFGLGCKDADVEMRLAADGSSTFQSAGKITAAKLFDVVDFLRGHGITNIDLMKINIEGGEYDLLERLIAAGVIYRVKNIQVQFHDFVPNAALRMRQIQDALSRTHRLTYQYEFVWENWEILDGPLEAEKGI